MSRAFYFDLVENVKKHSFGFYTKLDHFETLVTVKQIHRLFFIALMSSSSSVFVLLSCRLLWFYFWPPLLPEKLVSSWSVSHPRWALLCLGESAAGSSSGS